MDRDALAKGRLGQRLCAADQHRPDAVHAAARDREHDFQAGRRLPPRVGDTRTPVAPLLQPLGDAVARVFQQVLVHARLFAYGHELAPRRLRQRVAFEGEHHQGAARDIHGEVDRRRCLTRLGRGAHHRFVVARRTQARRVPPHRLVHGITVVRHARREPQRPDRRGLLGGRDTGDGEARHLPTRAWITRDDERHDLAAAGGIQARADLRAQVTAGAEHVLHGGHGVAGFRDECGAPDALTNGPQDGRVERFQCALDSNVFNPLRRRELDDDRHAAGRGFGEEIDGREPLQVDEMLDRRADL